MRKLPGKKIVAWLFFLTVILAGPAGCASPREEPGQAPAPLANEEKMAAVKTISARVAEVVDGDTVHVRLPDGRKEKVRLIGVDTPESTREVEPYGKEASAYTRKKLDKKTVYLELDAGERDKYGRLLAYVWLSRPKDCCADEVRAGMFNAELLLNGYARVLTVPPNVKYSRLFVDFQREAREKKRGLWGLASKR